MPYKKITQSDIWDFEETGELEGEYTGMKEGVGANNSKLYYIKSGDGKEVAFWGSTLLDDQMRSVGIGSQIRIKYLGMEKSPKTGREYKNFETEVWED